MKTVKAVSPFIHSGHLNFKFSPYDAWKKNSGQIAKGHYPWRAFQWAAFRYELPSIIISDKEARLRFLEPVSLSFDTFPDYARYEIIPMVWDCWPCYFDKMCAWLKKHQVKTAIFTSSQTAERMRRRFPHMNIMFCPEAVDISSYTHGKRLKERSIDVLEFGRSSNLNVNLRSATQGDASLAKNLNYNPSRSFRYVCTKVNGKFVFTNEQLYEAMGDARITITLPRSCTEPELAGDIETLTQRYWECMLSRMVMLGHAPQELIDLIGYNPVIEIDKEHVKEQILDILAHIEDYQALVNKNRETALRIGSWDIRMKQVMDWLKGTGYEV